MAETESTVPNAPTLDAEDIEAAARDLLNEAQQILVEQLIRKLTEEYEKAHPAPEEELQDGASERSA